MYSVKIISFLDTIIVYYIYVFRVAHMLNVGRVALTTQEEKIAEFVNSVDLNEVVHYEPPKHKLSRKKRVYTNS